MHDIYLDFNATTPVAPEVVEAMLPWLGSRFGNPSSDHGIGREAREAVEQAREQVAALIGASPGEIIFTSGGTEASNLAIRGGLPTDRSAIVTTMIEHPATEACCALLEARGHRVARISPGPDGILDAAAVADALDDETGLVTLIHAQNEIGTVQPVAEIAMAARGKGALVHVDAAQSLGKIPVNVDELGVDLLSIAGHKLYAPKGVGVLYARRGIALRPVLVGAGQEHGIRPGTENVPYIVALGAACRVATERLFEFSTQSAAVSEHLLERLISEIPDLVLVGDSRQRLPNTLNVLFPHVTGRQVLHECKRVMASTGSACHADSEEPSAILTALGIERAAALGAVRLSAGRATTLLEAEAAAIDLADAWRSACSLYGKGSLL